MFLFEMFFGFCENILPVKMKCDFGKSSNCDLFFLKVLFVVYFSTNTSNKSICIIRAYNKYTSQ